MRRPQFSIRALLVVMMVAAAFFGGIRFERERRRREDEAVALAAAAAKATPKPARRLRSTKRKVTLSGTASTGRSATIEELKAAE